MRDFMGREIKAGDTVVYPVRRGSSMWLNKLNVTMVEAASLKGFSPEGRLTTIKNLKNVVVVQPVNTGGTDATV